MSSGYNKCTFVGNLGKDAELRHLPNNGDAVASFSVGANESWKDSQGNKKERCEWVNCSLFGKRAEALSQYLTKGTRVLVEGKLRTDKYEKDGETKYSTKVIVSDIVLMGGRRNEGDEEREESTPRGNGKSRREEPPPDEDEIPF